MRTMLPDLKEIRNKRKALNLTQQDLATRTNLSRSTITKIEIGYLDPSYSKVKRIFDTLNHLETQGAAPNRFENITLEDIHTTPIEYVDASQSIYEVYIRMVETAFSQFPVQSNGHIVGSITERAITRAVFESKGEKTNEQPIINILEEPFPILSITTPLILVNSLIVHTQAMLTQKNNDIIGIITNSDIGKVLELMKD